MVFASASKKINLIALIRTLTISTTTFERMKEKFCGFRQTEQLSPVQRCNLFNYYVRKNEGKILWFSADWTLKPGQTMQPFHTTTQHLLRRKSLNRLTTLLRYVTCCCLLLWEVCSQSKTLQQQMLYDRTFLLFSAMLRVVHPGLFISPVWLFKISWVRASAKFGKMFGASDHST